jgi:hypothetical protein
MAAGGAAGYVLGAKAGRQRYEEVTEAGSESHPAVTIARPARLP